MMHCALCQDVSDLAHYCASRFKINKANALDREMKNCLLKSNIYIGVGSYGTDI